MIHGQTETQALLPCGKEYTGATDKIRRIVETHRRVCRICQATQPIEATSSIMAGTDGSARQLTNRRMERMGRVAGVMADSEMSAHVFV